MICCMNSKYFYISTEGLDLAFLIEAACSSQRHPRCAQALWLSRNLILDSLDRYPVGIKLREKIRFIKPVGSFSSIINFSKEYVSRQKF